MYTVSEEGCGVHCVKRVWCTLSEGGVVGTVSKEGCGVHCE